MSFAQAVTNGIAILGQETLMTLYEGMMIVSHETQSLAQLSADHHLSQIYGSPRTNAFME